MRGGFRGSPRGGHGFGSSFNGHRRSGAPRGYFLGDTAFLYDDYPFESATPEPAQPQFGTMEAHATEAPAPRTPPLLIELQGDHYVRYGGAAESSERPVPAMRSVPARQNTGNTEDVANTKLPATILIFRDGHREQVADYAIVGPIMYAHRAGEQAIGGGFNNIQISALDVSATKNANRENGVSFVLPRSSNQVVPRP